MFKSGLHPGIAIPQPWCGLCLLTCLQASTLFSWCLNCLAMLFLCLASEVEVVSSRGCTERKQASTNGFSLKKSQKPIQWVHGNASRSLKGYCLKCTAKRIVCENILWRDPLKHHCDKGRKIPPGADLWLYATLYSQKHGSHSNKTSFSAKPFMYFSQDSFLPVEYLCWNQSNQKFHIQNVNGLESYYIYF